MTFHDFLKSKLTTWLLAVVLVMVSLIATKILVQKNQIDSEIKKLQTQADTIHKNNEQLSGLIDYFATSQYQEKQAREQLNLKKEGEYVVVLPPDNQDPEAGTTKAEQSNLHQWFAYFFDNK